MTFRNRTTTPPSGNQWIVQVGTQTTGYTGSFAFERAGQALLTYAGYHVHSGGKKRLMRNGKLIARHLTWANGTERVEPVPAGALF